MHGLSIVVFLSGYICFSFSVLRFKYVYFTYFLGFYVFMTIQFGPHTALFTDMLRLSVGVGNGSLNTVYNMFLGVFYLIFSLVMLSLPKKILFPSPVKTQGSISPVLERRCVLLFFILLIVSVALQPGLKVTAEHVKFIMGGSLFSYTDLRRVLFDGTAWSGFANIVRFTFVPIVFGLFFLKGLNQKERHRKIFWISLSVCVPLVIAVQLNKFFFLYFMVMGLLIYLSNKKEGVYYFNVKMSFIKSPLFLLFLVLFLSCVYTLYKFQYEQALDRGALTEESILDTLLFRVFFASSDSLRLWIEHFYFRTSPIGLAGIGKLCGTFSSECVNVNALIPQLYMGRELTTMQAGFLGTALSMLGVYAIPIFSVIVAFVVMANSYVQGLYVGSRAFAVVSSHFFLNSFFLTTRELHTAMFSGGAVLLAMVYYYLDKKVVFRRHGVA